ncbi:oligoendopeptidase F [Pelomyxa schiedti]|nr:oligoendopeptidase F [Pelomyxa schiedti]
MAATVTTKTRAEIEERWKWDLTPMFPNDEAWEVALLDLKTLLPAINELKGKLAVSVDNLVRVFELDDNLTRAMEKVLTYASLRSDEDTGNSQALAMKEKAESEKSKLCAATAWILPEIMKIPEEKIREFSVSPAMQPYKRALEVILRNKPHILTEDEERLLALADDTLDSSHTIYTLLTCADMKFPTIVNDNGETQQVTHGNFITLMQSQKRAVRKETFTALYTIYEKFRNTVAACLNATVKKDVFQATARHHPSALRASLHSDVVQQEVYDSLIEAMHRSLPAFYEYVHLKKTCLKLDAIDMYDIYVQIVPDFKMEVSFEQSVLWVKEALRPLGPNYCSIVDRAFNERWIDVYENVGKKSGAYSGGCFDSPPYMLLNHQPDLDSAFTLIHEMGHSMHTFLSNSHQTHLYAEYKIFVAEVASTVNELLLFTHLMKTSTDKKLKAYLLNHRCDDFRTTVFRQTMFAEYEKLIHNKVETGTPLTADVLCNEYFELNKLYYGPEMQTDPLIKYEWERIPHFHYNFYVYKYATSFCAAEKIVSLIMSGEPGFVQKYINFLSSGNIKDPLDLLAEMGVDLRSVQVIEDALSHFRVCVRELGELLAEESH